MLGNRQLSFEDYLGILRRHRHALWIPTVVGPIVGYLITLFLTPKYTSTSLILIEQPQVPNSIVQPVVSTDLAIRLATMQEQIESRSQLEPLITTYDLYRAERRRQTPIEDLVEQMQKDIVVSPVEFSSTPKGQAQSNKDQRIPGFTVSYTGSSPLVAQQICTQLTDRFITENLRMRERQATGTTSFVTSQLDDAKRKLDEADARLAEFKRQNIGQLPDEAQTNLQMLTSLNAQLAAATDAVNRATQQKTYTESLLLQQEASWQQANQSAVSSPQELQKTLDTLELQLLALQTKYTDDYPDVVKAKADIAQLKAKIAQATSPSDSANAKPTKPATEPAAIQQLRAQSKASDEEIKTKSQAVENLEKQIAKVQGRIQLSPEVEQRYKDITRDYQTALKFYQDLLNAQNQSQMSANLESRQAGEVFRVLDPANRPLEPSFPLVWLFMVGGLAAGIAVGVGIVLLQELRDKAMRDERDIEFFLELPTLAQLPVVGNGRSASGNGFRRRLVVFRKKIRLPQRSTTA